MQMTFSKLQFSVVRGLSVAALTVCAVTLAAQTPQLVGPEVPTAAQLVALPDTKFDLTKVDGVGYSSSAEETLAEPEVAGLDFKALTLDSTQPPPRRRYGRPRYNDNMHNPDGSNKYAFVAGVGFNVAADSITKQYLNTSYRFQVGAGRNFSKKAAILLQFDYDRFRLPDSLITSQRALYTAQGFYSLDQNGNRIPFNFRNLDGNAHIWSFTLNPTYNFYQSDTFGAYAVVGAAFTIR